MRRQWTEADYETMSWHDNHVYGFEVREGEDGTGDLILRLDYILEWLRPTNGVFSFVVAPASLHFHGVFGLRVELDYARVQAGMMPFSLTGIFREPLDQTPVSYRWTIPVNWPEGLLTFDAPGFTQTLLGDPVTTDHQYLDAR